MDAIIFNSFKLWGENTAKGQQNRVAIIRLTIRREEEEAKTKQNLKKRKSLIE